jgi:peptidoglycan/xylan/chitin deacetylase (PgdA/CDA1 family)
VLDDPAAQSDLLGSMAHSTEVFRGQMEVIARHFHPVTLDDVLLFVRGEKKLPPRSVVVTFDDGYADNYQVARPVLDQAGIPGVFYIAVDSVDRQTPPWPSHLRYTFLAAKVNSWKEPGGTVWSLNGREQRLLAFERASEYCAKLSGDAQRAFLDSMRGDLGAQPVALNRSLMMTWDEIRSLVQGGHTVGSHTMTHPNMAYISAAEAQTEFSESKRRLEEEMGKPVVHFSYPCPALQPHWAEQTVNLSRELGYSTGVTTNGGMVRTRDNALKLRRIRPTKTVEGLYWNLERTFSGAVV